jgi:hypothetical protein
MQGCAGWFSVSPCLGPIPGMPGFSAAESAGSGDGKLEGDLSGSRGVGAS